MNFLGRSVTIAKNTLLQVLRMKIYVLVFLLSLGMIGALFLDLPFIEDKAVPGAGALMMLKSVGYALMNLFAVLLSIAAISMTVTEEIRNRTLYLVFSKRVKVIEYLMGKWLGVMISIFIALFIINAFFFIVLSLKEHWVVLEQLRIAKEEGMSAADQAQLEYLIRQEGALWSLHLDAWAIFAKACTIASIALAMVCLSRSALFAMGASFFIVLIGMFQADAMRAFLGNESWAIGEFLLWGGIALFFPNMQAFDAFDWSQVSELNSMNAWFQITGLSAFYSIFYIGIAWVFLKNKELP